MPHFFIKTSDINGENIKITDKPTLHHLSRVMRLKIGEKLLLVDENQTSYTAQVLEICPQFIIAGILTSEKANHFLKTELFLAQGVLKSDAQALVIQKATELGVKGIYPVLTDNTVVKSSVIDAKIEKWNKYALEAFKQCERTDIPTVFERTTIEKLLESGEFATVIACVERTQESTLKEALKKVENRGKILVIIGPEGGFSAREVELFNKYKTLKVSLGKLILRAETAVITALSNIIYELEDEEL